MALTAGTRLGPYEILAPIGAGGMGEVYRARDSKLDREVAIKVLPADVAQDPERLARFEREAKVLASLNHPNIAQIYGVEERALIMELVPGTTVKGPLPLETALDYARQIADALQAAHEKSIIHRDLKPANIMITPAGVVKLLDFGLAAVAPSSDAFNPEHSPTLTISPTRAGMILGTAAYMSPEQARGKVVDKGADIWAFGVVLYEMLAGKRLFEGETISDTLAQVLTKEPDWEEVPAKVRRLLEECLQKDSKQRLQAVADWRLLLTDVQPQGIDSSRSRLGWVMTACVLAVTTVVASWIAWREERPAEPKPLVRLDVDLGSDVSLPAASNSVIISTNGTRLVYLSGNPPRLFTRRLDQTKAVELPGTEGASGPFFSPDGRWVGFVAGDKLDKISVEGGAAVPLADIAIPAGASWGEDEQIFVGQAIKRGVVQIPSNGGTSSPVTELASGEIAHVNPQVLPGGKAVLFVAYAAPGGGENATVEVVTLADRRRKILVRGGTSARYLPSGHLIYVNKGTLFALAFDLDRLETHGTPMPVLDDIDCEKSTGLARALDFSRAGTLIYRRGNPGGAALMTVQWRDAAGRKEPLRATPGVYSSPRISPDGKRLVLSVTEESQDVWVYDLQTHAMTRLTFGGLNQSPIWTPDGQYIVFEDVGNGLSWTRADGAGQPQPLIRTRSIMIPWSFTPDGKRLAYMELLGDRSQIWTVPVEGQGGQLKAGAPEPFLKTQFSDARPVFSPDGHWLAYSSNESGRYEVYVRTFPPQASGEAGKWQISNSGGGDPKWLRNGRELLYQAGDIGGENVNAQHTASVRQIMAVGLHSAGDGLVVEKPRLWLDKLGGIEFDLTPDGKRLAVLTPESAPEKSKHEHTVMFLENFFEDLRRKVTLKRE